LGQSKEGLFAFRLKVPQGYHSAAHTHPKPEIVTVLSGTARLGMGTTADHDKAQALPAGSFFALSPGSEHYFFADEDTVVQINSTGPWGINYVNPKDDPRPKTQWRDVGGLTMRTLRPRSAARRRAAPPCGIELN
jgi:hypothetical protein